MKVKNSTVKFESIIVGQNVRLPQNLRLATLADSIETNGLQEAVEVWQKGEEYHLLKGHRRHAAITIIRGRNEKRFAELFGEGVPAVIITGITDAEALIRKCDHDGQEGLSDPHELQLTANLLFAAGKTEAEVISLTSGLMDRVSPMSPNVRAEIAKMEAEGKTAEAAERRGKYRRGLVQGLHNAARCPDIVMHALYKRASGQAPVGVADYLPPLTTDNVTKLWEAHKADLTLLEGGVPKYNSQVTGPAFGALWGELCAKAKEQEGKPIVPKAKAMSAADMKAEIADRKYAAELTCVLIAYHAGDKTVSDRIPELDRLAAVGDMVRKHDAGLWASVEKVAKDILARLQAGNVKA